MRVLQLIDSLHAAGAERMAVNIANGLSDHIAIEQSYLCVTREEGVLKPLIAQNVRYLYLNKRSTFDFKAIRRLHQFVKQEKIDVIHAHSTSFFSAILSKFSNTNAKIVWHDHHGNRINTPFLKKLVLKISSVFFNTIITVNKDLEKWARKNLHTKNVVYIPNFVSLDGIKGESKLHGSEGKRIVCLANLKNPKNHLGLTRAFKEVLKTHNDWSIHFIGKTFHDNYLNEIQEFLKEFELENNVFIYGSKSDISHILKQCQIGVLASTFEGLPMALLEYGINGLAVVSTDVGECKTVISDFGIVIEPNQDKKLANALNDYIENQPKRLSDGRNLQIRIENNYSSKVVLNEIYKNYKL